MKATRTRERRWLALALPLFPVEVARRIEPALASKPLALVERKGGSLYIRAASLEALEQGVRPGTTHAHALAACPELVVRERREEHEREALLALARWASHAIAPRPAVDSTRPSILVDVTGTELVHGPEEKLLENALAALRAFGHEGRAVTAATPLAALAIAMHAEPKAERPAMHAEPKAERPAMALETTSARVVARSDMRALLEPLPVPALGLEPEVLESLEALGIRSVGDLLRLPRASLPVRWGEELIAVIERALGERPHGIEPIKLPREVRERIVLEGGTDRREDLEAALVELTRRVLERLATEGRAPRSLELTVDREDGAPEAIAIELAAPVASLGGLFPIVRDRLERLDLGRLVTALALTVTETGRGRERQGLLFAARGTALVPPDEAELACLLARLEGRLGPRRVVRAELVADHRPERAFVYRPAGESRVHPRRTVERMTGPRPSRLFARPAVVTLELDEAGAPGSLRLRGRDQAIVRAAGPERIEVGFWDGCEVRRDYWVVACESGKELWVFQEIESGRWYWHGVYE